VTDQLTGALAPPLVNGEAVFQAPWEGRVFGMAYALASAGVFEWDEFRDCLIAEIALHEPGADGSYPYYQYFQRALERLLAARGLISNEQLVARSAVLVARHHGHDHEHGHHHDHDHDDH
jgi:nitrile hydratase accessory protein